MILADNGSPWYISGVPDDGWNSDVLVQELRRVHGSDLGAVDVSSLMWIPIRARRVVSDPLDAACTHG